MLKIASKKDSKYGRVNDDRRAFINNIAASQVLTPPKLSGISNIKSSFSPTKVSFSKQSRALGLPRSTGYRILKTAWTKRQLLKTHDDATEWHTIPCRRMPTKISIDLRNEILNWIPNSDHMITSPFFNDTLKMKNDQGTKEDVPKLLLTCSVRDIHSELLNGIKGLRDEEGKARIGDSTVRKILPDNLRPFTARYKQMCGCEVCIVISSLH